MYVVYDTFLRKITKSALLRYLQEVCDEQGPDMGDFESENLGELLNLDGLTVEGSKELLKRLQTKKS